MKTIGDVRIQSRQLIHKLVRSNKVELDDIRYIKYGTGSFPDKITTYTDPADGKEKTKRTPYQKDDIFIIFDVRFLPGIGGEVIGNSYRSHLPIELIINIYGDEAEDEVQYMIAQMSTFRFRNWLRKQGFSIKSEPNFEALDGRENMEWWIRRRAVFELNTEQIITYSDNDGLFGEFDEATTNVDVLEEGDM